MTVRIFQPYSIYTMRLARKGELFTHEKDKAVLSLLKVDNVIERDFKTVMPEMNLKEVVDIIATSKRNLFPVVDAAGNFKGVVLLDDIRNIPSRPLQENAREPVHVHTAGPHRPRNAYGRGYEDFRQDPCLEPSGNGRGQICGIREQVEDIQFIPRPSAALYR